MPLADGKLAKLAGTHSRDVAKTLLSLVNRTETLTLTQQVHAEVIVHGLQTDVVLGSSLAKAYIESGRLEIASGAFNRIPEGNRNRHSWNTILSGYSKFKCYTDVLVLYNLMRRNCDGVDSFNLVFAIKACVGLWCLENGDLVHGLARKCGLERDAYVAPALVDMYAQIGVLGDAQKMFDEIPERNSVLWGVLMKAYLKFSKDPEVFNLYSLMRDSGLGFDVFTLQCLIRACGNISAIKEGKSVHGLCIKKNLIDCSGYLQACLVDTYVKCGLLDNALKLFDRIGGKDVVMWTTLISGFGKSERPFEAFYLFRQMLAESIHPNELTLASILVSCSSLGSLRHGKVVHGYMMRNGIQMDAVNYTSFIDMYARCGCVEMAEKVFDLMPEKNVVSWSSMINAFGINGLFEKAAKCFDQMKLQNIVPNSVTFVSLLSACSHSGDVKEGWEYFKSMTRDYGITPEEEHYACMIDLLGRAGKIREAMSFIDNMSVKPRASAWSALLGACRMHKKVKLAEEIAEKVLSLEPNETGVYVLLSNIYADAGMWAMVNCVRKKMGMKGFQKPLGLSATEVG